MKIILCFLIVCYLTKVDMTKIYICIKMSQIAPVSPTPLSYDNSREKNKAKTKDRTSGLVYKMFPNVASLLSRLIRNVLGSTI